MTTTSLCLPISADIERGLEKAEEPPASRATLPSRDKEPGTREGLLDGPEPEWLKSEESSGLGHRGEIAYWSGVNMATQYPSAMSLERLINISSGSSEPQPRPLSPNLPRDSEEQRRRSQAVHDAMRLILFRIILYTSACFLNETGHMPKTAVMAHKGKAIAMLNGQLRSHNYQTSDAVIAGVVQLIVDEWYWGDTDDLRAHMRGLREMIRIRGHDIGIALAHEIQPFLGNGMDYDYCDLTVLPFRIAHNTPLLPNIPSFATSADALGLHPTTASILDDMRFLINAVMSLPDHASPETKKRFDYVEIAFQTSLVEPQQASPTGNSFEDDRANTRSDADSSSSGNNQEPRPRPRLNPSHKRNGSIRRNLKHRYPDLLRTLRARTTCIG
ncbi:unnamed protein product [Parascedosporium putredinis]|uniref:Uncharacterized protein n=1 Tax=Parascedosporium putredinis TaxID=1442378 RepID=A0A9P1H5L3_9PEZI|nr:unnamed protein product [Parascedosporium putredinis]CAI7996485.1 unnamed protein product [Parascedosporium putredinis]